MKNSNSFVKNQWSWRNEVDVMSSLNRLHSRVRNSLRVSNHVRFILHNTPIFLNLPCVPFALFEGAEYCWKVQRSEPNALRVHCNSISCWHFFPLNNFIFRFFFMICVHSVNAYVQVICQRRYWTLWISGQSKAHLFHVSRRRRSASPSTIMAFSNVTSFLESFDGTSNESLVHS